MNKLVHTWEDGSIRLIHSIYNNKGVDKHVYILERKMADNLGAPMWVVFSRAFEDDKDQDNNLYLLCRSIHELKRTQLEFDE